MRGWGIPQSRIHGLSHFVHFENRDLFTHWDRMDNIKGYWKSQPFLLSQQMSGVYVPLPHTHLFNDLGFLVGLVCPITHTRVCCWAALFHIYKNSQTLFFPKKAVHVAGFQSPMDTLRVPWILCWEVVSRTFLKILQIPGAEFLDLVKVLELGSHTELPWTSASWFHFTSRNESFSPTVANSVVRSKDLSVIPNDFDKYVTPNYNQQFCHWSFSWAHYS